LSVAASAAGGVCSFAGFYLSYRFDLPLGPLIVVSLCALLVVSNAARWLVPAHGR
jgi:ABC-type Mn2+/Zn2+ transport system permease subunit